MIKPLPWDSNFFKITTGEWLYANEDALGAQDFDLIYGKGDQDTQAGIAGFNNTFSETKVVFTKLLHVAPEKDDAIQSIAEANHVTPQLYALAYESGKYSRFKLDPNFGNDNFEKLYRVWVDNSLNRQFATDVLAYCIDGKPAGFVTYKIHDGFAVIGLIAVSANHQGKGIGRKLLQFVENVLLENNIGELRIPTQLENKDACGFYTKMGYEVFETTHIKHFWKSAI